VSLSIDYRSFSAEGPSNKVFNRQWWRASKEEMPEAIAGVIHTLQEAQTAIDGQRSICVRLYGNSPLYGINGLTYSKVPSAIPAIKDRITYNLCQSVVDAKTSKIAKNKPKPLFLTERGNYKLRRKAQKLNQFIDGVFFQNKVREQSPIIYRDAEVIGTGCTHVYGKDGMVHHERVMAGELLVDEMEAMYGDPRQLHRVKNVDRYVLAEYFPAKVKKIMDVNESTDPSAAAKPHVSDQVTVAESWHLPSGPEAKDGLHTIIIDGAILFMEEWTESFFPFSFLHSGRRMYGFWGQSAVERLQNIQLEINKLLWVIQRSMHLAGTFKIFLEQGSKIVKEHLNNDIGAIINYTGAPPNYVTPPVVQPEIYQHLATLIQRGFEQEGVSMLSAAAKKPDGLDSGKALREFNDIESDRFMISGQAYEQYHLDLAKLDIYTARDISEGKEKVKVKVPGSKFIDTVAWEDVDMEEDQYVMQCFPISSLPQEPAGRTATINEWIQAGWIDPRQGRRLMDFPDLDQVESLANAVEERILSGLDKIIDDGEYTAPDQYMDAQLARELCLQYINEYTVQGLEEERLQMLRDFLSQLDALDAKVAQAAPPVQPQQLSPGLELPPPASPPPLMQ
jgi:hypothetical protein